MKKKGSTLIECMIAITIFLIGIIPITKFTLNSLGINDRSNEIEEAARITTTVIDHIKSENYDAISANDPSGTYTYKINSGWVDLGNPDTSPTEKENISDITFALDSRGINLDGAELEISIMKSNLVLVTEEDYTNPVNKSTNKIIFGTNDPDDSSNDGLLKDQPIYGRVTLSYESEKDSSGELKEYGQNFILVPIENWKGGSS